GVLVPCRLDTRVHRLLHVLPECVAVGLDRHAATDRGLIGQPSLVDYIEVPLREIVIPIRQILDKLRLRLVCHTRSPSLVCYTTMPASRVRRGQLSATSRALQRG